MALDYKSSLGRYRRYLETVQKQPLFRASLFVVFSLVLLIALLIWALRPTLVTISGLLGTIEQQKEIEDKLNRKIVALQQAQQAYQQLQPRLTFLDGGLPTSLDMAVWARNVEQIASGSGIELVGINVEKIEVAGTATEGGLVRIGFTMTAKGQYSQFRMFVVALENMRRVVDLSDIKIDKGGLTVKGTIGFYAKTTN